MKGISLPFCFALALFWANSLVGVHGQISPELREEGVLYFQDNLPNTITLTLKTSLTIYLHRDFAAAQGQFYSGQTVEVIGMAPEGYLLKGDYRGNTVTGWIKPQDLPPGIDPTLFQLARKRQQQRDAVAAAIANKTVIEGMSPDEVKQALGRPERTDSHVDLSGATESWTYTTYREQPQYYYAYDSFGHLIPQCYYVKVPVGQIVVEFTGNAVTAISQHQLDRDSTGSLANFPTSN